MCMYMCIWGTDSWNRFSRVTLSLSVSLIPLWSFTLSSLALSSIALILSTVRFPISLSRIRIGSSACMHQRSFLLMMLLTNFFLVVTSDTCTLLFIIHTQTRMQSLNAESICIDLWINLWLHSIELLNPFPKLDLICCDFLLFVVWAIWKYCFTHIQSLNHSLTYTSLIFPLLDVDDTKKNRWFLFFVHFATGGFIGDAFYCHCWLLQNILDFS